MEHASDVTLLRRELIRMAREAERKDAEAAGKFAEYEGVIEGLRAENLGLRAENLDMKRRLAYYENPHSPPSKKSLPSVKRQAARKIKAGGAAPVGEARRPGRKPGHEGVTRARRAQATVHHTPGACASCGGSDLRPAGTRCKRVTDIPAIPRCVTTCHVYHDRACNACGAKTEPAGAGIPGTEIGPNLAALAVMAWFRNGSLNGVVGELNAFGAGVSKATAQHLLAACSRVMEPHAEGIRADLKWAWLVHWDETGMPVAGGNGWAWIAVAVGPRARCAVCVVVASSRARPVLDLILPGWEDVPAVTDGLSVYAPIVRKQRCWAHVTRDSEYASRGCRGAHLLHEELKDLYRRAKGLAGAARGPEPPPDLDDRIRRMEAEVLAIADGYERLGIGFHTTLRGAAGQLFTFVRHPHMEPTNSPAERMIRPAVVSRKVRGGLSTPGGMKMFGTLMTCLLTWQRRGLDPTDKLLEVLGAT